MSLTKKIRTLANNSHGDVDVEAADADARLELVDAAAAAADARLELVDAAAAAAADRLPLAGFGHAFRCVGEETKRAAAVTALALRTRWHRRSVLIRTLLYGD